MGDSDGSREFFTEESSESSASDEQVEEMEIEIPEESNLSKIISDQTTRSVIVLVLGVLII